MNCELVDLVSEIRKAAQQAFLSLFKNGETYYYCTLVTTGEGHTPIVSAWSWEAFEREKLNLKNIADVDLIKWSYADSPYFNYGEEYFENVEKILSKRRSINNLDHEQWEKEILFRLQAMELAIQYIDNEGIFTLNQPRERIGIFVEIMPPEEINTEIALRLNDSETEIMKTWLEEVSE